MKKLKISLMTTLFATVLAISTMVFAYGSQVDTGNKITMPSSLTDGVGTVSASISGDMSYQFVEITSEQYAKYKKYEAQMNLIEAYIKGDSNYDSLATNYEKTYNQTANGITTEYGIQFNEEGLNALKNLWIAELVNYNDSAWIKSTDSKIKLDLTAFEGTKYYIGWVEIGTTYDAQAYKVVGTKTQKEKEPETTTPEKTNDDNKDKDKTDTPSTTNKTNTNKTTTNKDNTVVAKKIPYAGASDILIYLIVVATVIAGISYIRYRKIK